MNLKRRLVALFPRHQQLPARYAFLRLRGQLDDEIALLPTLIGRPGRAIDVGANVGFYTLALSKLCRPVEAFEPLPWHARLIADSKLAGVTVHNVALANVEGHHPLYIPQIRGQYLDGLASFSKPDGPCKVLDVPVKRLDDFQFGDVCFIKVDVEGLEMDVLRGGSETIARCKPVMLVEIEQRHLSGTDIGTVFKEIQDFGYEGQFLFEKSLRPLSEFSFEKYQQPFLEDDAKGIFAHKNRGKVNNFIFLPV
ncbi:MAG TPA: FkbM family methyltransferase [Defluviicoccus sp.]|nr:FkbM family methyltransferase [Defluviicoccus sp.]